MAKRRAVLGIDSSTSALKAIAFDAHGAVLAEARATYPMATPAPGFFEQNAEDWWQALCVATKAVLPNLDGVAIEALAIGHQRETFVLVDRKAQPLRPAITWLDERARAEVAALSGSIGRARIRDISGKPPDPTPALYALAWLARQEPQTLQSAACVLDVQAYLNARLTGEFVTSTASADPLGILDVSQGTWSDELVAATGLTAAQLPRLATPGTVIGTMSKAAALETGLPAGLPIVAGAGDGQLSGLGLNAMGGGRAYLSLGTGIVSGMHSTSYTTSDGYRTLTSPDGTGFMMETVLRSGMTLAEWAVTVMDNGKPPAERLASLAAEAERIGPGSEGLLALPYFAGVMNPYWDEAARGAFLGLSLSHTPAHMFRAIIEGLAFEQGVATAAMEASLGSRAELFVACGGGVKSSLVLKVMAAVLGRPIAISPVSEGVALGAAMLAASACGMHANPSAAANAMTSPFETVIEPDPALSSAYAPLLSIYHDVYSATRDIHARLHALRSENTP